MRDRENNDNFYVTLIIGLIIIVSLIRSCDREESNFHASDAEVNVVR